MGNFGPPMATAAAAGLVVKEVVKNVTRTVEDAQALAALANDAASNENRTMLAVEIPLILLAIFTVALRVYSRLGIKRKLAVDDGLIICGTVCMDIRGWF